MGDDMAHLGEAMRADEVRPARGWREVVDAAGGLAIIAGALLTPSLRSRRVRWGTSPRDLARRYPGDELISDPRWGWTHSVHIAAPAHDVWPWLAQIGADRGGFYSYAPLENLVGCRLRNADRVHPEWEAREGDGLSIHPSMPPLRIVSVEPGRHVLAHAALDEGARRDGRSWTEGSWLFLIEPLAEWDSRVVSRYRCATSSDRRTRLSFGPALIEPIGFAMDRRMLLGLRQRAECGVRCTQPEVASR